MGEGLVEDLAPSFLSVRISADEPPPAADPDDADPDDAGEADVRRTVWVRGWGERWRDTAVADSARLALAGRN